LLLLTPWGRGRHASIFEHQLHLPKAGIEGEFEAAFRNPRPTACRRLVVGGPAHVLDMAARLRLTADQVR
jgi:hypothetical protein